LHVLHDFVDAAVVGANVENFKLLIGELISDSGEEKGKNALLVQEKFKKATHLSTASFVKTKSRL
jgi:hypothetical protein